MLRDAHHIIMVTPERLGDTLMCTPAIHYLKHYYPQLKIDVIALSPLSAETLQHNTDIHKIFVLPGHRWLKDHATHYDAAINIHDGPLARRYLSLLSVPCYTIGAENPQLHQAEQALQFMQQCLPGHPPILSRQYQLPATPADYGTAEKLLLSAKVNLEQDILIGCQIGCHSIAKKNWGRLKKLSHQKVWPWEYFEQLGVHLQKINPHIRLVWVGSQTESQLGKKLQRRVANSINLVNQTRVPELKALMRYLQIFIAPDSGLMHVACSTSTPLIALIGPTQFQRTRPYPLNASHVHILRAATMSEISVAQVLNEIMAILQNLQRFQQFLRQPPETTITH